MYHAEHDAIPMMFPRLDGAVVVGTGAEPDGDGTGAAVDTLLAEVSDLTAALHGLRVIAEAVGLTMCRFQVTSDAAHAMLEQLSVDRYAEVGDVAAELLAAHHAGL